VLLELLHTPALLQLTVLRLLLLLLLLLLGLLLVLSASPSGGW
jgi:hypothetical protein